MLFFDWSSLIIFSSIVNSIICITILILSKSKHKMKLSIWIVLVLVCVALILTERIIRFSSLEASYPRLLFITSPLFFFILPLIYVFQKRLSGLSKYWYLHFLTPFIVFIFLLPTITMNSSDKLKMYRTEGLNDPVWLILFYLLFALFYTRKTFITNKQHKAYLLNEYASNDIELQLFSNQLVLFSSVLTITIPISLSIQYIDFNKEIFDKCLFILFSAIPHFILISILTLTYTFADDSTKAYNEKQQPTKPLVGNLEALKCELTDYMTNKRPYLNQNLNLQGFANSIGWSRSHLSMVINRGFEKNFYDFINEYRLNLVIEKLNNGDHKEYSLDYIVNESGFKNYVSFYRIFKRKKQESPKNYLKQLKRG